MKLAIALAIVAVVRFVLVIIDSVWTRKYKSIKVVTRVLDVAVIALVLVMLFQTIDAFATASPILI